MVMAGVVACPFIPMATAPVMPTSLAGYMEAERLAAVQSATFEAFVDAQLRAIANGLNLPYELLK